MTEPQTPATPPTGQPDQAPAQPPQAKKGMGAIGWIAIGCLVLLLLAAGSCFIVGMFANKKMHDVAQKFEKNPAMASAEMVVRLNPDLEMIGKDEDAGTITIREKKTGKTMTVDVGEIKQGKIHFSTDDGQDVQMRLDEGGMQVQRRDSSGEQSATAIGGAGAKLPDWVPTYPGSSGAGGLSSTDARGRTGSADYASDDPVDDVIAYYKDALERAGFDVDRHDMSVGGDVVGASLSATSEATGRTVQITANRASDQARTSIVINYSEKN